MSAIMCQHVKAVSDAYHMYGKLNIMSVFIHEHVKAVSDDHHMLGRPNTTFMCSIGCHACSFVIVKIIMSKHIHLKDGQP